MASIIVLSGWRGNGGFGLSRAMMECLLAATLSSYREVVGQTKLLLGHSRSHESIRKNVLTEARLIIEHKQKHLQQIENLAIPEKEVPPFSYTEADATYIKLQRPEKDRKLEIKLGIGIGYTSKENRYYSGSSQRLKEKFIYTGIGKNFMHSFSLIAEEELNLSQSEKNYFGGDGDTWIASGIRDYFPRATFILCRFHLFKRLRESLLVRKINRG